MGGLHRKVSVRSLVVLPGKSSELLALEKAAPLVAKPEVWTEFTEVDCGCCSVSFTRHGKQLPNLAYLEIRTVSGSRWRPSPKSGPEWLAAALRRVLSCRADFVVVYDFRGALPSAQLTKGLVKFCSEHREQWKLRQRSTALLIQDNILAMASDPLTTIIKAVTLGSPFVVCHGKAAAEEFFGVGLCGAVPSKACATAPFVTMVDVLDAPRWTPSRADCMATCLAALAPLLPRSGPTDAYSQAHAFHVLPNGDVRVIQSPPRDVVNGMFDAAKSKRQSYDSESRRLLQSGVFSGSDINAVAALKLECAREQVAQLIGTHFHFGELMYDAEIESVTKASTGLPIYVHRSSSGCFSHLNFVARKLVRLVAAGMLGAT